MACFLRRFLSEQTRMHQMSASVQDGKNKSMFGFLKTLFGSKPVPQKTGAAGPRVPFPLKTAPGKPSSVKPVAKPVAAKASGSKPASLPPRPTSKPAAKPGGDK